MRLTVQRMMGSDWWMKEMLVEAIAMRQVCTLSVARLTSAHAFSELRKGTLRLRALWIVVKQCIRRLSLQPKRQTTVRARDNARIVTFKKMTKRMQVLRQCAHLSISSWVHQRQTKFGRLVGNPWTLKG